MRTRSGSDPGERRRLYFLLLVATFGLAGCLATGWLIVLPALEEHAGDLVVGCLYGLIPALPYLWLIKFLDRNVVQGFV